MTLTLEEQNQLKHFANQIRIHTLETLNHRGFGHYGGSLSIVETLAVLYGKLMPTTPDIFEQKNRDYFVLSKGHAGPALYSTLHLKGFFDKEFLHSLNNNGTRLPSHPDRNLTPGIDMTTGSLGHGISVATGIAYGQQIQDSPFVTYAIVGDGELNEGQCWEAFQFAAHHQLKNLIVFIDDNKKQLDGTTDEICQTQDFVAKMTAFGFEAVRVKGDDIEGIHDAILAAKESSSPAPKAIVLDSIKGQGVPLLENMEANHHLRLDDDLRLALEKALSELEAREEVTV
ncbi:transketolase [Streptococcus cameli]